mmetsp:Transcript_38108/g.107660  ORF Transcript_38108/g.107660 Transcript_38108/m.107660 type:complete len:629 (-) Transcript_38108:134-2020(-)
MGSSTSTLDGRLAGTTSTPLPHNMGLSGATLEQPAPALPGDLFAKAACPRGSGVLPEDFGDFEEACTSSAPARSDRAALTGAATGGVSSELGPGSGAGEGEAPAGFRDGQSPWTSDVPEALPDTLTGGSGGSATPQGTAKASSTEGGGGALGVLPSTRNGTAYLGLASDDAFAGFGASAAAIPPQEAARVDDDEFGGFAAAEPGQEQLPSRPEATEGSSRAGPLSLDLFGDIDVALDNAPISLDLPPGKPEEEESHIEPDGLTAAEEVHLAAAHAAPDGRNDEWAWPDASVLSTASQDESLVVAPSQPLERFLPPEMQAEDDRWANWAGAAPEDPPAPQKSLHTAEPQGEVDDWAPFQSEPGSEAVSERPALDATDWEPDDAVAFGGDGNEFADFAEAGNLAELAAFAAPAALSDFLEPPEAMGAPCSRGDVWCALLEAAASILQEAEQWWKGLSPLMQDGSIEEVVRKSEVHKFMQSLARVVFVWKVLSFAIEANGLKHSSPLHQEAASELLSHCKEAWEGGASAEGAVSELCTLRGFLLRCLSEAEDVEAASFAEWTAPEILQMEDLLSASPGGHCALSTLPMEHLSISSGAVEWGPHRRCLQPLAALWRARVSATDLAEACTSFD